MHRPALPLHKCTRRHLYGDNQHTTCTLIRAGADGVSCDVAIEHSHRKICHPFHRACDDHGRGAAEQERVCTAFRTCATRGSGSAHLSGSGPAHLSDSGSAYLCSSADFRAAHCSSNICAARHVRSSRCAAAVRASRSVSRRSHATRRNTAGACGSAAGKATKRRPGPRTSEPGRRAPT